MCTVLPKCAPFLQMCAILCKCAPFCANVHYFAVWISMTWKPVDLSSVTDMAWIGGSNSCFLGWPPIVH